MQSIIMMLPGRVPSVIFIPSQPHHHEEPKLCHEGKIECHPKVLDADLPPAVIGFFAAFALVVGVLLWAANR